MAERIAVTMTAEPTVDERQASRDPELAQLIEGCLKKSPDERIGDAKKIAAVLSGQESLHATKISSPVLASVPSILDRRAWLRTAGSAIAAVAGAGGVYGGYQWLNRPPAIRSIAVMPLIDDGPTGGTIPEMQTRLLGHGEQLAAAIADQLSRIPGLRIVPYLPLRDAESAANSEPLPTAVSRAQQLGVDAVLVGSVKVDGQGFETIEVKLIEGRQGSQVLTYTVRVRSEENLIGQQATASKVAAGLGRKLSEYQAGEIPSNMSYHCLVNGYSRLDPESHGSLRDAIACFKKAIDQDQKFGEAYAGLSLAAMLLVDQVGQVERLGLVATARQACSDALELDPSLGPARLAKAMLAWQVDWQFDEAGQIFTENISRMPENWVAQHEYALFLAARGDLEGARGHAARAIGLDPTSLTFRVDANRLRWFAGEHETAQKQFENELENASGMRLAIVKGAMLDLLEHTGQLNEANRLLTGSSKPISDEAYWSSRLESISQFPYGPFDLPLNEIIVKIRATESRGSDSNSEADWDSDWLDLINKLPPRMPFVVSAHPAFEPFRDSTALRRADCRTRRL